jgi:hypothetical protein
MRKERTAVSVAASSSLTEAKRDASDDCSVRMATDRPPSSCRHIWGGWRNCTESRGGRETIAPFRCPQAGPPEAAGMFGEGGGNV